MFATLQGNPSYSSNERQFIFPEMHEERQRKKACSLIETTRKVARKRKSTSVARRKKKGWHSEGQAERTIARQPAVKTSPRIHGESHSHTEESQTSTAEVPRINEEVYRGPGAFSAPSTTMCDRKQTNGSDRGRQCAFKTRQTVICHVFHGL